MLLLLLSLGCSSYEGDEAGECTDGADNDQDGLFDCADDGCAGSPDCVEDTDTTDTGDEVDTGNETETGEDTDSETDETGETDTDTGTDTGEDTGSENDFPQDCSPLPPPTGTVITVQPSDAANLVSIINSASEGDTILFADGDYNVSGNIIISTEGLTLRSESGNRDSVILNANYQGGSIISITASNVTVADLTVRHAYYHGIHVRPTGGSTEHILNPLIYNVRVHNASEQGIKVNQDGTTYVDNGMIACSRIDMDDYGRSNVRNNCYTGGIDIHRTESWVIRDNHIEGIWCESGLAEHGIHMWRQNANTLIERNTIVNCARGIGLGMATSSDGNDRFPATPSDCPSGTFVDDYNGRVQNNTIFADSSGLFSSAYGFDSGISLWSACNSEVYHNTVWSTQAPFSSIEYRFDSTTAILKNNLVSHQIRDRGVTSAELEANLEGASSSLLVNPDAGDLHLNPSGTGAIDAGVVIPDIVDDFEGDPRDSNPDIGADEFAP